ncbi:MAG: transketolase [Candidatus Tectomicrobia bacterium]|uniref:Transketolase n=1 Tax=Tectimicrobiota bacterium TaxID=2528274 RepID=A0A937VY85_UNCTE|nr:transketolase [Candidatus Tectomicrobia bacterium]
MTDTRTSLLQRLETEARQIRRHVWRALHAAGSGHVGGSSSAADILAALYFHRMRIRPHEPDWPDRDRFVLSKGHANAALAAVLVQSEFIEEALLDRFYALESPLGMHPDIKVPGVEMSTGGLGHGLSVGIGMALGARIQGKPFHTYVMLGDGELHEGSNWEAAMSAAHYRLSNLTAIIDFNKIAQSGPIADLMGLAPLADKWRAFGWEVREIDGHAMAQIVDALEALPLHPDKPSALIAHTVKGKGVSFAENTYVWHSNTVNDETLARALAELETP